VVFDAPASCPRGFRPLLSGGTGCLIPVCGVCYHHRKASLRPALHVRPFAGWCHQLLRPPLTSAAPSRRLTAPVALRSNSTPCGSAAFKAERQLSQGKTRDLRAIYPPHLRPHLPGDIGLRAFWLPRPDADASCDVCSSGRHFAYSFLQVSPCCSASGSHHQGPQRTFTSKSAAGYHPGHIAPVTALRAMLGAQQKKARDRSPGLAACQ